MHAFPAVARLFTHPPLMSSSPPRPAAPGRSAAARRTRRPTLSPRTLPRQIVEIVRHEIVTGRWAPGERLPSSVLEERFGVSHIPIREVFKMLEGEGFLRLEPNRAAVVTEPTVEDTEGKLQVLDALEMLAVELACMKAPDGALRQIADLHERMETCYRRGDAAGFHRLNLEIHRAIVDASGNWSLAGVYEAMGRHVARARALAHLGEQLPDDSLAQHRRLVEALLARDLPAAREAMREHRATVHRLLLKPHEPA